MKFLVIGLGSMGKRRVRNLIALQEKNIAGFDISIERTKETYEKYNIETFNNFKEAINIYKPDVFIISTPPNLHMNYAYYAYEHNIHCFIEASVVDSQKIIELDKIIKNTNLIIVPSCTMKYFPAPKKLKELVESKVVGESLNLNYQSGQYLPDWHPWEKIKDFYVSDPDTGGCREIVPFELTWLNSLFGDAKPLACVRKKLTDINADIDDIYHCIIEYNNKLIMNLTVEVVSRPEAVRDFRLLGSEGEIVYSSDTNILKYINTSMKEWKEISFEEGTIESHYINPEEPYINEIQDFIKAIKNNDISLFPNSLMDDYKVLNNLYDLEELSDSNTILQK